MKAKIFVLSLMSVAVLIFVGCGSSGGTGTSSPEPTDRPTNVAICDDLSGRHFTGVDGQGGEPMEGCEGCGNDGGIIFNSASSVDVNWPGDDVVMICDYETSGTRLEINCDGDITVMEFSPNCSRLTGNGATFVRQ